MKTGAPCQVSKALLPSERPLPLASTDRPRTPQPLNRGWGCRLGVLVLAGWSLLSARGAATLTVGTNINISQTAGNNAEETIAISPLNPNDLFASETWSLVSKYSTNGGVTWRSSNLSALPGSIGDVSAAWDSYGNLFLASLSDSLNIMVAISTNGGASFRLLYETPSSGNDQPTVVTGPSATSGQGSVWISYTDPSNRLVAHGAAVTGLGAVGSFGSPEAAPGGTSGGDFGDIAIGPNGEVMVVYQNNGSGPGPDSIKINLDPDGLGPAGFGPAVTATSTQVGGWTYIPAQNNRSVDAEAGLAWDRSGGPHNGRIYLMYTDRPNTSSADTDIYVRYSDDKGTNWSPRVRVNDDTVGNGKSQFLPKIALDQSSGNIAVCFYDCRNSTANNRAEFWASASLDGGLTFVPNAKVSMGQSNSGAPGTGGFDFGDYTGLAFFGGVFYPCWADNSNSTGDNPAGANNALDMYTARVKVPGPPTITGIQPTNLILVMNQSATFTVTADSDTPLSYQWRKDGQTLAGATNSVYSLASAQVTNSGAYTVVVTNSVGPATSGVATLTVVPTVPLPSALDNTALTWNTDTATPWYGQTNVFHFAGTNAASGRSYFISDGQQTRLSTTVTGPGSLSFWWKVSSQANADFFTFSAYGGGWSNTAKISGELDWTQQFYYLPTGAVTVAWTYSKDASLSAGDDAGYLDQVVFTAGATPPQITQQPLSQGASAGRPATFTVGAIGTPVLAYEWQHNGAAISGATTSALTIASPTIASGGFYSVLVRNDYGSALSANAYLTVVPLAMAGDDSLGQLDVLGTATNAVAVAAGAWHNLVLKADGTVVGWGENYDGQCSPPLGLTGVTALAAGGYHSLALKANGKVAAWGADYNGQTDVPGWLSNVVAIAAGTWHSVALRADGTVVAWGDDSLQQTNVPAGLANVVAIAAGGNHSLALRADGTVVAWGDNADAVGNYAGQSMPPAGLTDVVAIGAGDYHSLAVKADGTVVGWGANGDGQSQPPAGLTGVKAVAGGAAHSLALKADGTVVAWGNNWYGQCTFPAGLSNVIAVAAGNLHSLVLVGVPAGPLVLLNPQRQGSQFSVSVQTLNDKQYELQYKTSLDATNWTALPAVSGNGSEQVLTDPAATGPQRFYRVRQY
jgi:Regulator of chromosome condensation (RCC1) repeat/Immunoglobulin domain